MSIAIVTGAGGLAGSAIARRFTDEGVDVVGIDNDMRAYFFGPDASTKSCAQGLIDSLKNYRHETLDIRDQSAIENLFSSLGTEIKYIVHCAAQPSHDWAATEPHTDFSVNAMGTLNLLESTR